MTKHVWIRVRSLVRIWLLTVMAVAGVSATAQASAHHRVWYFDDNFNTYNAGDVTDGWTKLVPPAWACGILFYDPSYYRWVNSDGVTIDDGNFNKNVRVWMGKPGCSESLGTFRITLTGRISSRASSRRSCRRSSTAGCAAAW